METMLILSMFGLLMHNVQLVYGQGCMFPKFVQAGDTDDQSEWHGHIIKSKEKGHSFQIVVSFKDYQMQSLVVGGNHIANPPAPYTRMCIQEVGHWKFLVEHREMTYHQKKFACMAIVKRSDHVIQLKMSRLSDFNDVALCNDDQLNLDPWPLVNKLSMFTAREKCPLTGGFSIKMYDHMERRSICDAITGETRLESECMEGEGMFFRFRHATCIPKNLHMHTTQRVFCMASWSEGRYSFALIRHENKDHQWCFRYPNTHGPDFIAYLFKDVVCDPTDIPKMTQNILQVAMLTDKPRLLGSLCSDDYDGCNTWQDPCRQVGSAQYKTCARTCGLCTDSRPTTCTLPSRFYGKWLETYKDGKDIIHVEELFLNLKNLSRLQCIRWDTGYYSNFDFSEQMLVATFDNGCRPRYFCAQFQKRTSSIMRFKLSQAQVWPFEKVDGSTVDCKSFSYRDDAPPLNDYYRNRHFKTLVSMAEREYVDCKFLGPRRFDVTFHDGSEDGLRPNTKCNGNLTSDGLSSRNLMKLVLSDKCHGYPHEQRFACLDSFTHGYKDDQMIVSESLDSSSQLHCWLFPANPSHKFYLLPATQCNEGARDKVVHGLLEPIITFQEQRSVVVDAVYQIDSSNGIGDTEDVYVSSREGPHGSDVLHGNNMDSVPDPPEPYSSSSSLIDHLQVSMFSGVVFSVMVTTYNR